MVVGVLRLEVQFYDPGSLKAKRSLVQRLLARCRNRFPVSAAETGLHDLWQRAELGFTMVSGDRQLIERVFAEIEAEIDNDGQAQIGERLVEIFQY